MRNLFQGQKRGISKTFIGQKGMLSKGPIREALKQFRKRPIKQTLKKARTPRRSKLPTPIRDIVIEI